MSTTVFLDGLNQIGFSFGLALAKNKKKFNCCGYDTERYIISEAKKQGAINKVVSGVPQGLKVADIVVVDLPADLLEQHYEIIGEHARPGTVIIDTSAVPIEVGRLAEKFLSKDVHLVSMVPGLSFSALDESKLRHEAAREDLFNDSRIAISSPSLSVLDAEDVASKFAFLFGATPIYMDALEVQVALVKTRLLPRLISASLIQMLSNQPGWDEAKQLGSSDFYKTSFPVMNIFDIIEPGKEFLVNQELVLRMLDEYLVELKFLRQSLASNTPEKFNEMINGAIEQRAVWQSNREKNSFRAMTNKETSGTSEMFRQMFLGGLGKSKPSDD